MNVAIYTRFSGGADATGLDQLRAIEAKLQKLRLPWKIVAVCHEVGSSKGTKNAILELLKGLRAENIEKHAVAALVQGRTMFRKALDRCSNNAPLTCLSGCSDLKLRMKLEFNE